MRHCNHRAGSKQPAFPGMPKPMATALTSSHNCIQLMEHLNQVIRESGYQVVGIRKSGYQVSTNIRQICRIFPETMITCILIICYPDVLFFVSCCLCGYEGN